MVKKKKNSSGFKLELVITQYIGIVIKNIVNVVTLLFKKKKKAMNKKFTTFFIIVELTNFY